MLITDKPIGIQEDTACECIFPEPSNPKDELIFEAVCRWCQETRTRHSTWPGSRSSNLMPEEAGFIRA